MAAATIACTPFGATAGGEQVALYTLDNGNGMTAGICTYGGALVSLCVPDRDGQLADVVLGFDSTAGYCADTHYVGAVIGRYANRIRDGRYTLDGHTVQLDVNHGRHHLHGGAGGLHRRVWRARAFVRGGSAWLALSCLSRDGDQGYPGNLHVHVLYELRRDQTLRVHCGATTDRPTPVSLTHHAYFNLAGHGDIVEHELQLAASRYLPVDHEGLPLGGMSPVEGTPFDFRAPRAIATGLAQEADCEQLRLRQGYDHHWVLGQPRPGSLSLATVLRDPGSGRMMELHTSAPGLQVYTSNCLDGTQQGKGRAVARRGGICLEPQQFPDAPNQPGFPNAILRPGELYGMQVEYRFRNGGGWKL